MTILELYQNEVYLLECCKIPITPWMLLMVQHALSWVVQQPSQNVWVTLGRILHQETSRAFAVLI